MKKNQIIAFILLSILTCWPMVAYAAAGQASKSKAPTFDPVAALNLYPGRWFPAYNWALQNWAADNKPYRYKRAEIDNSVKSGVDAVSLVQKYQTLAVSHPFDPKPAFALAYAYYKARLLQPNQTKQLKFSSSKDPDYLLENAPNPNAFDYERLLFLEHGLQNDIGPDVIVAGYRLYVHNPADLEVELALAKIVDVFHPGPFRKLGLYLANDLADKQPESRVARGLLSDDYYAIWQYSHSPTDAAAAINAERAYMANAHATPTQIAGDLRIDEINHYVPGQGPGILSPLNLEFYEHLVAKNPNDWASWAAITSHYYHRWRITRSRADANACIDADQHVLDSGPKDDYFQSGVKATIAEVKSGVPRVFKKISKSE